MLVEPIKLPLDLPVEYAVVGIPSCRAWSLFIVYFLDDLNIEFKWNENLYLFSEHSSFEISLLLHALVVKRISKNSHSTTREEQEILRLSRPRTLTLKFLSTVSIYQMLSVL